MIVSIMMNYLFIFFIISFCIYFIYALVVKPFSYKLSSKTIIFISDVINDYLIMTAVLAFIMISFRNTLLLYQPLYFLVGFLVVLSAGVFLSEYTAGLLIKTVKADNFIKAVVYIILFITVFIIYNLTITNKFFPVYF